MLQGQKLQVDLTSLFSTSSNSGKRESPLMFIFINGRRKPFSIKRVWGMTSSQWNELTDILILLWFSWRVSRRRERFTRSWGTGVGSSSSHSSQPYMRSPQGVFLLQPSSNTASTGPVSLGRGGRNLKRWRTPTSLNRVFFFHCCTILILREARNSWNLLLGVVAVGGMFNKR